MTRAKNITPGLALLYAHLLGQALRVVLDQLDEEGDCLIWNGALNHGTPVMRLPYYQMAALRTHLGDRFVEAQERPRQQLRVRNLLTELLTYRHPPKSQFRRAFLLPVVCDCGRCVQPGHAAWRTNAQAVAIGLEKRPEAHKRLQSARMAEKKQVLSGEQVQALRTRLDVSAASLAREMGICRKTAWRVRNGLSYKNYAPSPFDGLGAR